MKCIERSYSKKWDLDCGHPFPRVSDIREGVRLRRFVLQSVECTINSVVVEGDMVAMVEIPSCVTTSTSCDVT